MPRVDSDGSTGTNEDAHHLAEDEAIISNLNMWQLINHCLRTHDPSWDDEDPRNIEKVEEMVNVGPVFAFVVHMRLIN
jgi:hypothetical protein